MEKVFTLADLSHHTVMQQVRRNLVRELVEKARTDPDARTDLYEFLALEESPVDTDILGRLSSLEEAERVLARIRMPAVMDRVPRPKLHALSLTGIGRYLREWPEYLILNWFTKYLRRSLWLRDELQVLQVLKTPEEGGQRRD